MRKCQERWEEEVIGPFVCVYITCKCMHLYCLRATLVVLNQLKFNLHWCSVFLSVCLFVCQSVYLFLLCHEMILSFLFVCVRFCCWFFSFLKISLFCFVSPLSIFFLIFFASCTALCCIWRRWCDRRWHSVGSGNASFVNEVFALWTLNLVHCEQFIWLHILRTVVWNDRAKFSRWSNFRSVFFRLDSGVKLKPSFIK